MKGSEAEELRFVFDRVRGQLEDSAVRGTRGGGAESRARLTSLVAELHGLGATRLASRLAEFEDSLGSSEATLKLMEAQTALRLVERVATLDASAQALRQAASREDEDHYGDEHEE